MKRMLVVVSLALIGLTGAAFAQEKLVSDVIQTSAGELKITFIGHASLYFTFKGKVIHVDPYSSVGDYSQLPKADVVLITHDHRDHLDLKALNAVRTPATITVLSRICAKQIEDGIILDNGDTTIIGDVRIDAIPAYNIVQKRNTGELYHPKGEGNGYILTFGDKKVYIAGDTENIPEMKALKGIDVAFLPMNMPNTMTPEMVADAAKAFKPKILYPYHLRGSDTSKLADLLKDVKEVEVRIRKM